MLNERQRHLIKRFFFACFFVFVGYICFGKKNPSSVKTIKLLSPGDIVGEFALFDKGSGIETRTAGVVVVGEMRVLAIEITLENLMDICCIHPQHLKRPQSARDSLK
jgi:CRP-like cAMP-binding protein